LQGKLGIALACAGLFAAINAGPAMAQTGGATPPPDQQPTTPTPGVATLNADGSATPPANAPRAVRKAINAGNKIRFRPYKWGGGHRRFKDKGYDCSGAVSFVLHAAGLLKTPMASGGLAKMWGVPGTGQWITVYANGGHAYAVIAGLRWDTSAVGESLTSGTGPRWRSTGRDPAGYSSKYFTGY
jgi:hypothetical protein